MSNRRGVYLLGLAAAAAALTPSIATTQTTRDSAGMRIITNDAPKSPGLLRIATSPRFVTSPERGPQYTFDRIAGVLRISGHRYIVVDRETSQLRVFDSTGTYVRDVSVKVDGEENTPPAVRPTRAVVRLQGDTIGLLDVFEATVVDAVAGNAYRITSRRRSEPGPRMEMLYAVLPAATGLFVELEQGQPTDRALGSEWTHTPRAVLRTRSGRVHELGPLAIGRLTMSTNGAMPRWLAPDAMVCTGNGRLFYGMGSAYAISVYSAQGELQSSIRRQWTPTPVTRADWDRWVREWSKRWVTATGADSLRQVEEVRAAPYARSLPSFAGCLVDETGRLWVREAHLDDSFSAGSLSHDPIVPSVWSVFSDTGTWLTDVTMPAFFQPTDIGADYVAGRARSASGTAAVVVYDLLGGAR